MPCPLPTTEREREWWGRLYEIKGEARSVEHGFGERRDKPQLSNGTIWHVHGGVMVVVVVVGYVTEDSCTAARNAAIEKSPQNSFSKNTLYL